MGWRRRGDKRRKNTRKRWSREGQKEDGERPEEGRDRQSETRQALLGEQSRTFESRHGHRHTSLGVRKEKKETLGPPRKENKTQPG